MKYIVGSNHVSYQIQMDIKDEFRYAFYYYNLFEFIGDYYYALYYKLDTSAEQ